MTFSFRYRIELSQEGVLQIKEPFLALMSDDPMTVQLSSGTPDRLIADCSRVVLGGSGYLDSAAAEAAGRLWRSRLERAFAYLRVGADFGDRAPRGGFTRAGIELMEEAGGRRVLNDDHGLMVYESEPKPVFVGISGAGMFVSASQQRLVEIVDLAGDHEPTTEHESVAFDLFAASYRTRTADARFILLMMACETLTKLSSRSDQSIEHVDKLIDATQSADLPDLERRSIVGALGGLKRHSARHSGRELASTLGDREYGGHDPIAFFDRCYDMRSKLVHGGFPRPSQSDVGLLAAGLEVFVSHLIATPALVDDIEQAT